MGRGSLAIGYCRLHACRSLRCNGDAVGLLAVFRCCHASAAHHFATCLTCCQQCCGVYGLQCCTAANAQPGLHVVRCSPCAMILLPGQGRLCTAGGIYSPTCPCPSSITIHNRWVVHANRCTLPICNCLWFHGNGASSECPVAVKHQTLAVSMPITHISCGIN